MGRVTGKILQAATFVAVTAALPTAFAGRVTDESSDRSMEFVEKSVEATELYNQSKLSEALVAFEELVRNYGDLDEDGYIAMSLGDCLLSLGRHDEADAVYRLVQNAHAELAEVVQQRLWETALAGEPDDLLLNELRAAAATETENAHAVNVQLGRALQKRAVALLSEAMDAFRSAAASEPALAPSARRIMAGQADMLAELREDLTSLVERLERAWGAMKTLTEKCDGSGESAEHQIDGLHAAWMAASDDHAPIRMEMTWDDRNNVQATANKRPVQLNPTQSLIIRRHQERINAIMLEAMQAGPADPAPPR